MLKAFIILLSLARGIFTNHDCFEEYGYSVDNHISKSEYERLEIRFARLIKPRCRVGPMYITWKKDKVLIRSRSEKKTRYMVDDILRFYSLSKSDAGNYTIVVRNNKFNYSFTVVLTVDNGSAQLKRLRDRIIPSNGSLVSSDQIYWMPHMIVINNQEVVTSYDDFSLKCFFYSKKLLKPSVEWFLKRSLDGTSDTRDMDLGNLVTSQSSRVNSKLTMIRCDADPWMPVSSGDCYMSQLSFNPFLDSDSGRYTCVINKVLNTSFMLLIEVTDLEALIQRSKDGSKMGPGKKRDDGHNITLSFNDNDTVCDGAQYLFQCNVSVDVDNISLWFSSDTKPMVLLASNASRVLVHQLTVTSIKHSDYFLCRAFPSRDQIMYLRIQGCFSYSLMWNIVLPICAVSLVIVLLVLYHYVRRIHRRLNLRNKLNSTQFKVDSMFSNDRYIPLQLDFSWEILRSDVILSSHMLGSGEYGRVFKAAVKGKPVAVKIAKPEGGLILAQEIELMKSLEYHQNVIQLLGVCSINGPLMAILELAEKGNLKQYLMDHNPVLDPSCEQISLEQLLSYVTQIATGMEFLALKHVIHQDLAARNCLLTDDMCVKLSDFGLTRFAINYYLNDSQGNRAIAWTAPESIVSDMFTTKSDVWSFGIVMWEVFELGASPYPALSCQELLASIRHGIVNTQPSRASDDVYSIMTRCWALEPNDRPSFSELRALLDRVDVNEYL